MAEGLDHLQQARYEQAIASFHRALELDPGLITAHYDLGVSYFAQGQFEEARRAFERVLRFNPGHQFAAYFLARLDLMQGNLEAAIAGFQALSGHKPVADELYYLGAAYFRKGEVPAAIRTLQQGLVAKREDHRIHFLLARAYRKNGQDVEAERHMALSEKLRAANQQTARDILGCKAALNSRDLPSALEQCRQLLDGFDSTKLVSLGISLGERQLYQDAIPPLAKAAQLDPENYEPHFNLGLTYFKIKDYSAAKKWLETAVALRPESYDAVALLGSTLFALGEDYGAVQHLRHAHQLRPTDGKIRTLLFQELRIIAQHLSAEGDQKQSAAFLEESRSLR